MAKLFQIFFRNLAISSPKNIYIMKEHSLSIFIFFILAKSCIKEKKGGKKKTASHPPLIHHPLDPKKKLFSQNVFFSIEMTHLMTSPKQTYPWHQLPKKNNPTNPTQNTHTPKEHPKKKKGKKERKKEKERKREREAHTEEKRTIEN